jgi:hypothetical protein
MPVHCRLRRRSGTAITSRQPPGSVGHMFGFVLVNSGPKTGPLFTKSLTLQAGRSPSTPASEIANSRIESRASGLASSETSEKAIAFRIRYEARRGFFVGLLGPRAIP